MIGNPIGRRTIGPASSGLGEGLAVVGRQVNNNLFLTDLPSYNKTCFKTCTYPTGSVGISAS
jgi:hypothetical protein